MAGGPWIEGPWIVGMAFARLAEIAWRSTALLALAWLGAAGLRRSAPALRQGLWSCVLVGALALPLLTPMLPAWRVLPAAAWKTPLEVSAAASTSAVATTPSVATGGEWTPAAEPLAGTTRLGAQPPRAPADWRAWVVTGWALGAFAVALWFVAGLTVLRVVSHGARPADAALAAAARRITARLGIDRPVRVLLSERMASPATWGLWRPIVALPAAARHWSAERRRLVLAHELVHVARWDWALRLVAQAGCALYWFDPLTWVAARRLRREQELACDLAVLDLGARPSTYARHLLNIARAATRGRGLPALALDMARPGTMEGRLMSILADPTTRKLRRGALLPALSVLVALPLLAAVQPQVPPTPAAARVLGESPTAAVALDGAPEGRSRPAERPSPSERQIEGEISRRAAEIEALMAPFQAEVNRQMDGQMAPLVDQLGHIEVDMAPFQEELDRLGRDLDEVVSREMSALMPNEAWARQAEALAREIEGRSHLTEQMMRGEPVDAERLQALREQLQADLEPMRRQMEEFHQRLAEQQVPMEELQARLEPYRARMAELRAQMEPQRERLEALHLELEPLQESLEQLREHQLDAVRERLEELQREIRELELERQGSDGE